MGHWEQTGRDNAEERARLASLPRWRRVAAEHGRAALLASAWIAAGALVLRMLRVW